MAHEIPRQLRLTDLDTGRTMDIPEAPNQGVWNAGDDYWNVAEPYPAEPGPITPVDIKVDRHLTAKDTNPKDAVGIRKWRQFTTIPMTVMAELGVAMLEGGRKYGVSNYRVAGVRSSVYIDAAFGHIMQWWEGEDIDADSKLSHVTKAIASLVVLRDAMINDKLEDDRPPKANLGELRDNMQVVVDDLFVRIPDPKGRFTEKDYPDAP